MAKADYTSIDRSALLKFLFYPRPHATPCPEGAFDLEVPVAPQTSIFCRFYGGLEKGRWILYFHGNGEVVSDYDAIAPFYHAKQLNLVVADYRGYGKSTGTPNFTHLLADAHLILKAVREEMSRRGWPTDLWVMGRSMGSLAAVELGYHHPDEIRGLVIESGFASVTRLIRHLRLPSHGIDLEPIERERLAVIQKIAIPVLIIHGEWDSLVPLVEAKDLYAHLGSKDKELVIVPEADHNNVMFVDLELYLSAIQKFIQRTLSPSENTRGPKGPSD